MRVLEPIGVTLWVFLFNLMYLLLYLFYIMANFHDISKDFFKKDYTERLILIQELFKDLQENIIDREVSKMVLLDLLEVFLLQAEEKEDYETAMVINEIKILLEKTNV